MEFLTEPVYIIYMHITAEWKYFEMKSVVQNDRNASEKNEISLLQNHDN